MNTVAYILVAAGILAAKCFGFLRDAVFASVFGASELTDIYFQVFSIASLVFTGIGGTLSTLIIKNLNKPENAGEENQRKYVSRFITKTSLIIIVITAVLYLFSENIVSLILPGLKDELVNTAVRIMYIMLPSCLFVTVAYIICGVLQNSKVFFITSVMSLPYNAVIIAYLIFGKADIIAVSAVTTVGWLLHVLILLPSFYKKGYRMAGGIKARSKGSFSGEAVCIFIGSMMFQLCFMIDKAAVSFDSGMASTVNYASNLFITISSVFVVAMSNVSYPTICRHFENNDLLYVRKFLRYIIVVLLAIFIPFILVANLSGREIISLLYERGEFGSELTGTTATLFAIYTFGIFGYVCQELFNKILYLDSKYSYPVIGTAAVVLLKLIVNRIIPESAGVAGVAISTTVLFTLYAVGVWISIGRVVGNFVNAELGKNVLKILLSALAAFVTYALMGRLPIGILASEAGFIVKLIACGGVYIAVILLTGCGKYILKNSDISIVKNRERIE